MTAQWLTDKFRIIHGEVTVYQDGDSDISCNLDWLAGEIANASTHAELSDLPIAEQGWQKVFDQWRDLGLVS